MSAFLFFFPLRAVVSRDIWKPYRGLKGDLIMRKRILLLTSVLFGLLSILITAIPGWGEVAFTRYKYGAYNNGFGCCYTIYGQDYDCQGSRITQYSGHSCYDTGSGDWIYGTCGGGCVGATCSGVATTFCVGVNPNIPCTLHCSVFLDLLGDTGPANCTQQQDQYCSNPVPFDAAADLDGGYFCDKRTPQMVASGCRCLSIGTFSPVGLNLSTGQGAQFTGNISAAGSSLSWTIQLKDGQTIRKTINGSGSSLSSWDGKDDSGKEVSAGDYTATLNVSAAGGWCGDTDTSTANITVTATPTSGACSNDENFGLMPSLEGVCGSTVNFASGNVSHSQPLFTLPNSKFMGGIQSLLQQPEQPE